MTKPTLPGKLSRTLPPALLVAAFALVVCGTALAATTDIGTAPLFTSSASAVKPNIMFILDDSGSMKSDFLPDEAGQFSTSKYGRKSAQCNGVAYNPAINYQVPVDYTGTALANASLTFITPNPSTQTNNQRRLGSAILTPPVVGNLITVQPQGGTARSSWYTVGDVVTVFQSATSYFVGTVTAWNNSTRNLQISVTFVSLGAVAMATPTVGDGEPNSSVYYTYTGSEPRLGFTYNALGNVITNSTFYSQCNSVVGSTPGSAVFTPVVVTTASAEAQNYANWFVYYRTRIDMMKSSVSLAFKSIDNRYRLGYSTISEDTVTEGTNFLNIRDVDPSVTIGATGKTQKQLFYESVNAAQAVSYTPLRGALAKAGQYFAKKAAGQTYDPMQYSCQRNFSILSTDGYWNTQDESTIAPKYGPYQLDRTTPVGQQDSGATRRPMFDGGTVTATTTETWTSTKTTVSSEATPSSTTTGTRQQSINVVAAAGAQQSTVKVLVKEMAVRPASFTRTNNIVVVTTSSAHNLVTGDVVNITASGTNAGFAATGVSITRISDTQFSYPSTGANGSGSNGFFNSAADIIVDPAASLSCASTSGVERSFLQLKNASYTVTSTDSTTTTPSTSTVTVTALENTPFTRTLKVQNGVTTLDETVPGTTTRPTPTRSTPVVTNDTPQTSSATTTTTSVAIGSTAALVPVPLATGTTCKTTAGAASTATGIASGTVSAQTLTLGNSTTTGTVVTTVVSTTTTESTHASDTQSTSTGGASNTLADVAMYYYQTDLRNSSLGNCTGSKGTDVCTDNVPGEDSDAAHSFGDNAPWQHMTTFTLGLGLSGLLTYDANYLTQQAGSFYDILSNGKNWPTPGDGQTAENIDDLWHAAVNGRGQYFSAGDPTTLARSLNSALDSIKQITGAASAASTSSLQPVEGDNDIYVAQFTTAKWIGDVLSFKIDPRTGQIAKTPTWSARTQLDAVTPGSRKIYYPSGTTLKTFTYTNLSNDGLAGLFDNFCTKPGASGSTSPEQCSSLLPSQRDAANTGSNLVSFLRGNQTRTYYRTRANVLGDIINASPLFIGKPGFKYGENNYQQFVAAKAARQAVVLAAANDGMLHAFDRATGSELWAFVPSFVMPNLYKLADTSYSNFHSYFVDGSPQVGDIYVDDNDGNGPHWKTIVVGGLNAGGRGYYALDVTDPSLPKLLWEFRNDDLGLTFSNPIITKRTSGTWVVTFGSGYNNVSPGDGNGHLFVLNANTGALVSKIDTMLPNGTAAGSTATPSGFSRINSWVDSETDNTAKRYYGADLLGNVWRFDIDQIVDPKGAALLLAQLTTPSGAPQPVTVTPPLAEVQYNGQNYPVVYVPTGRYLGTGDLLDTSVQSIYAIKDPLTNTSYGVVRNNVNFVTQTITASGNTRTNATSNKVDWSTKAGWRVDLPVGGERVSVNPQLALDTLFIGTNVPNNDACTVGGNSFLYQFDIVNGTSVASYVGNVLVQGLTVVQLGSDGNGSFSDGGGGLDLIITRSDGIPTSLPQPPKALPGGLRRSSWRELVN